MPRTETKWGQSKIKLLLKPETDGKTANQKTQLGCGPSLSHFMERRIQIKNTPSLMGGNRFIADLPPRSVKDQGFKTKQGIGLK